MSQKLKNRKQIQGPLSEFVGQMVISPELVDSICAASVDPDFEVRHPTGIPKGTPVPVLRQESLIRPRRRSLGGGGKETCWRAVCASDSALC